MYLHQLSSPFLKNYILNKFGKISLIESKATCDDCICSKHDRGSLPYYQKDLKCCTFHPFLPNYAVGAILENRTTPEFIKRKIKAKINEREYTLPLGIFAPLNYQIQFNNREENDFGNKIEFLCPYFDNKMKNCGIWTHRGAVCTSYFCVSDRGEAGLKAWELLGEYLHLCEMILSQDALVSMGLPPEIIENQLEYVNCNSGTKEEMSSSSMSQSLFQEYWKEWPNLNTISDYYINCSQYISSLSNEQLENILNEETYQLELQLKDLFMNK